MDPLMEWLHADPVRLYVLVGVGGIVAGTLLLLAARWGWHHGDPPYEAVRRRKAQPNPWDRDHTGELILDPTSQRAVDRYRASLTAPPAPGETRRSLDPAWRRAILSPTGSWSMPNDGRRHHHRATGSKGEETRRLHPGYVAEARARVERGEDPGELPG